MPGVVKQELQEKQEPEDEEMVQAWYRQEWPFGKADANLSHSP